MADVIIGGRAITVALPNFKTLKAAWRYIDAVQAAVDPMDGVDAILGVISVGAVGASPTVEDLEDQLTPCEMAGLRPFMNALMIEIGLAAPGAGEAAPAEGAASPSTATSTASSPNSSPPAAAAGTGTDREGALDLHRYGKMQRHWARHGLAGLHRRRPLSGPRTGPEWAPRTS